MIDEDISTPSIHFERITAKTVLDICHLSETLYPNQRESVADNAVSIAQGHFSEHAWMRAIYADDTPIGFIMLHFGSDWADGIDCPGVFLWRFMISGAYQGQRYGAAAMKHLVQHLRAMGIPELYTSFHPGIEGPGRFYEKLGFLPTGEFYGDEPEVVLKIC
jgi:diamine N-acetyltransferase